jgi:hypothetical protein
MATQRYVNKANSSGIFISTAAPAAASGAPASAAMRSNALTTKSYAAIIRLSTKLHMLCRARDKR